ncbi:MAG: twin-arginine translocation signal domain-containing protein [Candidatus Saccharimonadales bacterium]
MPTTESLPDIGLSRRQLLYGLAGAAAAAAIGGCGTPEKPEGSAGGVGGGGEVVDLHTKFYDVMAGLTTGGYPDLARSINTAIGFAPIETVDSKIILPRSQGAVEFNSTDFTERGSGKTMSVWVLQERQIDGLKTSDTTIAHFNKEGIQPQTHPGLPGYLCYYSGKAHPVGHFVAIEEGQPVGGMIVDVVLGHYSRDTKQRTEVPGGYQLTAGVAVEFYKALTD